MKTARRLEGRFSGQLPLHKQIARELAVPLLPEPQYCEQRGFSSRVCEGGLDYLVGSWQKVVAEICAGYNGLFDEYLDDMDGRRIIAELLPLASDSERTQAAALLPTLHAQFLEATRPTDSCIWGEHNAAKYGYRPDHDWWYYRLPANLTRVHDPGQWPQPAVR